jgi:Skp family chaperone for outer membrane proteins
VRNLGLALAACAVMVVAAVPASAQTPPKNGALPGLQATGPTTPQFGDAPRIGYVDVERVAALSNDGKAATTKLEGVRSKIAADATQRRKQVESLQQKLAQGASTLNEAAMASLRRDFERAQVDFQRFTEDGQAELASTQQELLRAFRARLFPVVGEVATERQLWAVFSSDSMLLWYSPAIDLSEEVARRLDSQAPAQ